MAFDLFFLAILLGMAAFGAWRGAMASAVGLVALLAGYAGAIAAATSLAEPIGQALVVPALAAPAVAGTLGFAVVWLVASAAGDVAIAWDAQRVGSDGRGGVDRALGCAVGLLRGGLVVMLLAVLASWLDAARDLGAVEGLASLPDAADSAAVSASGTVVESLVSTALADAGPAGAVAARITARPAETLGSVQSLLEDPRVAQIFEDRLFWTLMTNDSVDYAMHRAAIRSIVEDPELRGRFADLGLVGSEAREDPEVFRAAMGDVLTEVAPRIHRLQDDPELNALARDPEVIALVQNGDMMALMAHPTIRKLVERASSPSHQRK
ncbi:MAG: CvpA family protein [Myxococcota bacterium]